MKASFDFPQHPIGISTADIIGTSIQVTIRAEHQFALSFLWLKKSKNIRQYTDNFRNHIPVWTIFVLQKCATEHRDELAVSFESAMEFCDTDDTCSVFSDLLWYLEVN